MTRLIDADEFLKEIAPMNKWCYCGSWKWCMCKERQFVISEVIKKIESAPTLETTDEVLERLPKFYTFSIRFDGLDWKLETPYGNYSGNTPYEAVKKLEESINTK